jgi:aspartyl-tRNA(Asn)/glutamyl-tRNA(Gln) amidotransferase subunit A
MSDLTTRSALDLGTAIATGRVDARDATEAFISEIEAGDPDARVFYVRTFDRARAEAAAAHDRTTRSMSRSPLDGVPLSWKDLFDSAGDECRAGSAMLSGRVPARDAAVLQRLATAGTICLGKTAMTELAFSGLGINPVLGTPANARDTATERAPGGSSSGAAVGLARNMCAAAIGTDTGGSVRIPAAWNGVVGFKPSHGTAPLGGVVPLCPSLDTVGPLARTVPDAATLYGLLTLRPAPLAGGSSLRGRHILVPSDIVFDDCDPGVAEAVNAALGPLASAGATLRHESLPPLTHMNALTWGSGISLPAIEGWSIWKETIAAKGSMMYPPVRQRFEGGATPKAADAWALARDRAALRAELTRALIGIDAIAMPAIPIDPPPISDLVEGGPAYDRANRLALRNTTLGNQLDMCAVTLPCGTSAAGLPVGLMLMAPAGRDASLLQLAGAVEATLR